MPSLSVRTDHCAVLADDDIGRRGGNCERPPTTEGVWRFETPGPLRILLCDMHAAELAGHERLTLTSR